MNQRLALALLLTFGLLSACDLVHRDFYSYAIAKPVDAAYDTPNPSATPTTIPTATPSSTPTPTPSPTPTASPTPTPPADGTITVTIPDPAVLTVGFSSTPATIASGSQITISTTAIPGATSYLWQLDPVPDSPAAPVDGTTGSSVLIKGSDLQAGNQYSLTLFVLVDGNLYSGSFSFVVSN